MLLTFTQAIGAAQDAARMERVVNFYARLPRGNAPEKRPSGLLERYQARYFGDNASAMRESCRTNKHI
jgi:F-type H+-transporting ATPase subunit f